MSHNPMFAENSQNPDDEVILAVRDDHGIVHKFRGDEVAEAVHLPGGQVLVVNMAGERNDLIDGKIIFARGEWKAWVRHGDETKSRVLKDGIQEHRGHVTVWSDYSFLGNSITRIKRKELLTE